MATDGHRCVFCSTTSDVVGMGVLDRKWWERFGGEPAVALDHGWYTTVLGQRTIADRVAPRKSFCSRVRAVCDYCAHGWIEDVRWRAEPALLSLALGRQTTVLPEQAAELSRWACLTAMLAERVDGMPTASSFEQRDSVRRGVAPDPNISSWFFATRQRLPARVHLSQVPVTTPHAGAALVQVVSVDLAHLSVVVVLPSLPAARDLVERSTLTAALGGAPPAERTTSASVGALDLSREPHPHRIAVQRLCSTAGAACS